MATFKNQIDHVVKNEPVTAGVTSRATRQLESNVQLLKSLLDSALQGKALIYQGALLESSVLIGQPVFWDETDKRFEKALAAVQADPTTGTLLPAASADVFGVVLSKSTPTTGDVLVFGIATLDLSNAVDGNVTAGRYYLSTTEAGKLVSTKPNTVIPVLYQFDTDKVFVSPSLRDFSDDHTHYLIDLAAVPAGDHTPPSPGGTHSIANADSNLDGWLPATDPIFNGLAPAGAKFGYNISQNTKLQAAWPPVPVTSAVVEMLRPSIWEEVGEIHTSVTLDFPSTAAQAQSDLTATITGARSGDSVLITPPTGFPASGVVQGWVSADDTVTIRYTNPTASSVDPASGTFQITVLKDPAATRVQYRGYQQVPTELCVVDNNGIWWMTDCYNQVPWVTDYGSAGSAPAGCPLEPQMKMRIAFLRFGFAADKTVVTSLQSKSSLLTVEDCAGNAASTGALHLDFNWTAALEDTGETGALVLKDLNSTSGKFQRGYVVEGLKAGSNITLTGTTTRKENAADPNSATIYQGIVQVNADTGLTGKELPVQLVRASDARERYDGSVMTLGLPDTQASSLRCKTHIPPVGLGTSPSVKIRIEFVADGSGTTPAITVTYAIVPAASATPASLPSGDTAVSFAASGKTVNANDYFSVESDAISIAAGDTLFFTVSRAGNDGYAAELGVLRIGVVIQ